MRATSQRNLPAITGLRGVAAMWVLLFHIFQSSGILIIKSGYAGVDVFFLLSGFVLSHVYLRNERLSTVRGYLRFLGVRLARIYPLHVFTLCCLLVVVLALPDFVVPYSHSGDRFSTSAFIASLFLIQNWGYWLPGNWNGPAWSLSAEWCAYLVFPILLLPIRRISSKPVLVGLAATALIGVIAALYLAGYRSLDGVGLSGTVRMAGEFTAGCLLYAAFWRGWRLPLVPSLVLIFVLLGIGLLLRSYDFVLLFAFAMIVVLAAQGHTRALEWRPVLFLGEISFSIYLTHWIVIQVFNWLGRRWVRWGATVMDVEILLAVGIISIATYHFIELPARKWGRRLALTDRPMSDLVVRTTEVAIPEDF